jgi:hypothetical protein
MEILGKRDSGESFPNGRFSVKEIGMTQMIGGDRCLEPFNWALMPDEISKRHAEGSLSSGLA